jgi:hypothetical protein
MKALEDAFSSAGFRRVVLPGIVITVGAHPLLKPALPFVHEMYGIEPNTLIIIEVILYGLLLSSSIQWIYYLYEGFRGSWFTKWASSYSEARVSKLCEELRQVQAGKDWEQLSPSNQNRALKIYERLQDFPLRSKDGKPERFADRPTQLGNVIATYELYPESRYGIEDIQFWNHLLFLAPADARKEFAEQYACAESLILTSFSGVLIALLHTLVLIAYFAGRYHPNTLTSYLSISALASTILLACGLLIWAGFYKAAVSAHRDVSAIMRSLIDLTFPAFVEWTAKMKTANTDFDPEWQRHLSSWLKDLRRS